MAKKRGAHAETAARWQDRVARQRTSGLSVAEFCRRERVHPVSFYYWRRRLPAAPQAVGGLLPRNAFLPIEVTSATGGSLPTRSVPGVDPCACEVWLGPLLCRLPQGLDDAAFRRVIRLLREEALRC